jgi:hypothetical protein
MRSPTNKRVLLVTAVAPILVFAVLILGYGLGYATVEGSCGGDGGSPYAADASPQGKLCDSAGEGTLFLVPFFVIPLILLAVTLLYAVRWGRTGTGLRPSLIFLALIPLTMVSSSFAISSPSDSCSPEDGAAYSAHLHQQAVIQAQFQQTGHIDPQSIPSAPANPPNCDRISS